MPEQEEEIDRKLAPAGYKRVEKFEDLGGSKGEQILLQLYILTVMPWEKESRIFMRKK